MTRFTDCDGKLIVLCDNCRQDMIVGDSAFSISPGKVSDGYFSRDYEKADIVICPTCADQLTRLVALLSDISTRGSHPRYFGIGRAQISPIQPSISA